VAKIAANNTQTVCVTDEALVVEAMTGRAVSVRPDTLLTEAYVTMMRAGVRRLPVVAEDGTLEGIVALSDLREARPNKPSSPSIYELNYLLASMQVRSVMTHNPYTVWEDTPLAVAAHTMLQHKVGGLPVLDAQGRLVGIITESDIFRRLVEHWNMPVGQHS